MVKRQHAPSGAPARDIPEPTLAERARTLVSIGRVGALSTHSRHWPGYPFGSMMPYAADHAGRPAIFVSSMAMHTQNLLGDMRASLLVMQPDAAGDPLAAARVTLVGAVVEAPAVEVRELYLSRHENARSWADFRDFTWYRMEVAAVYYIGGFGVMGWIEPADYAAAKPDPLAGAAPAIIQHMNTDHASAVRSIVERFGGVTAHEASITSVDRLGFHASYRDAEGVHGLRIAFPREVGSMDDARRVFVAMTTGARE